MKLHVFSEGSIRADQITEIAERILNDAQHR